MNKTEKEYKIYKELKIKLDTSTGYFSLIL